MNIHTKNGKRTIKLDATERRQMKATLDLLSELANYCPVAKRAHDELGGVVHGRLSDSTYDPLPIEIPSPNQSNQPKDALGEVGKVEKGSANGAGSTSPQRYPTARTTPKG